jgi:peptidoglycan/xylan/chitin deacetylase (PgdA/CDA1 family)
MLYLTEDRYTSLRRRTFVLFVAAVVTAGVVVVAHPSGAHERAATSGHVAQVHDGTGSNAGGRPSTGRSPSAASTPPSSSPTSPAGGASAEIRKLISLGLPIFCGGTEKPLVALTFDDGPGVLSPQAVEQLRAHHEQTTFFLVGWLLQQQWLRPELQKEIRFGATFGDHTWSHVSMVPGSSSLYADQISRTRNLEQQLTHQSVYLFRPPYGSQDSALNDYLRSQGMLDIMWSIDSRDSQGANADQIYRNVRKSIGPGSIVLMHDNRGTTENALPRILDLLDKLGLRSVSVPQLLTQDPPSVQQVRHRTCG